MTTGYYFGPPGVEAPRTAQHRALFLQRSETFPYSAVNLTTGVITATAISNAYVAGSFVQPPDGSATINTLIPDWDYGIQVVDQDGNSIASVDFPKVPVSGILDSSQILPV